jgi:phosphoribosylaminoimidazole carboxylase/phosphoribosylaminoimidazole-succinocarboxamide synthase
MQMINTIREGKTKKVIPSTENPALAIIESKNDITAHNAIMHDVMTGKAECATDTTCNVFRLLAACGIPIAFKKQLDATRFVATYCDMIPYEVVIRREAHGSYLKRNPHVQKGTPFPQLVIEFFLKTPGKQWNNIAIPKDDPYIQFKDNKAYLDCPDIPLHAQESFLILEDYPLYDKPQFFASIEQIARQTFLILERAWQNVGGTLVDLKIEFGFDASGNLLLADVIDNDSWRVVQHGNYIDKQVYRDGANLDTVANLYQKVRDLTAQFRIPKQRIIIWRASERDNVDTFMNALSSYCENTSVDIHLVTMSMHKQPMQGYYLFSKLLQEISDCVVIAFVGRSNGAGPILSAISSVPVITVPNGWDKFPEDIWSSLRTPSDTPVMTVLEPANAVLAAVQILAQRNPALYAKLRLSQEKRLFNMVEMPAYILPTTIENHI